MSNGRLSWKALALLATGAAGVRLVYLLAFARAYTPRRDANHYQAIAKAFAQGDGIAGIFPFTFQHPTAFRPPLYPALLGAVYWVTGVHVGVGQLVNVALGVVVVLLAALLGARIAGYRAGIAAGIVVGVYPPLLANDVVLLSEPLGLALLLTMILLLVRDRPAWAGAVCGLLVLTRPSAQLLVVVVAAWLVWRAGWRSAARFGALTIVVVAPWVVRNWVLVGTPTVVTSNGFNLVSTYSSEAQASGGFADAVFDDRFTRINLANRSEVDLEDAYRDHAIDAVRDHHTIPLRVLGHNFTNYFEFRPDKNANAEEDDGRNLGFRYATLPLFYVVTGAGLVGLWRARRRPGAELLLVQAAYFTAACLATIAVPRLRAPLDLAAAIGAGVLIAELTGRRVPEREASAPHSDRPRWSRRTRILVALATVAGVVVAAGGVAFARDRVEDNARSQLERTIDRDGPAVQRLAALDADALVSGAPAPTSAEYREAEDVADRLWLLSPRLAGAARTQARDAARSLDEAIFELKVLDLVTSGNRNPGMSPAAAIDASRVTYETEARPGNRRLPDWDTISTNSEMRRAAADLDRLERELSPWGALGLKPRAARCFRPNAARLGEAGGSLDSSSRPPVGIGRGLLARTATTTTRMTTTETETADLLAELPALLAEEPAVRAVIDRAPVVAVPEPARALYLAALTRVTTRRPILVAVPTAAEAERVAHDLSRYLGRDAAVELFPAWETLPFERVSPSLDTMGRRLRVIWKLRAGGQHLPEVVVAPVRALVQRLGPHVEDFEPIRVHPGVQLDRDALVNRLVAFGYRREYQVEARGEVAVRGSIVDVYPATDDHPVRIDLWGDEVDRLSRFSVADQRSTDEVDEAWVFPARELLPTDEVRDRAAGLVGREPWGREQWERLADGQVFDGMESWLPWLSDREHLLPDLLPDDALVLLVEPKRTRDRAQELLDEEAALGSTLSATWGATSGREFPRLSLPFDRLLAHTKAGATALLAAPESPDTPLLAGTGFDPVVGDTEGLTRRLRDLRDGGARVVLAADGEGTAGRLHDVLAGEGVTTIRGVAPGEIGIVVAPLERGVVVPAAGLAVIAEADLTGRRRVHRRPRGARRGADFYDALEPGDFVVHYQHGVGRYKEMTTRAIGGVERDYLLLEYRAGDKLYVPTDQVGAVRRYTGGETPTLNRMGGSDWEKTRARVRSAVREIAQELVVLYRRRLATPGHAFAPDTPWQREIEEAFPYEETPDQAQAIEDVKADMERPVPMDRLVCGDVGYGKTEVAIRAAFKAVQDGKQVAVLVPTTLLANQHGQTFRERFANYPVRVEVLSRFLTAREQAAVVNGVTEGSVDVVIATHRLLSGDVRFKDLGLLVVDEEQRFGVQHKELVKQLRADVDVLTLTATPIPRTLEMSLTGIRDLSLVNTPPEDRQPILTYVGEFDDRAAAEAIRRELLREGQVFFVHNRVQDIDFVSEQLRELVPEARIGVAHGQMDEGRLERVVLDFWEREYDVLVCTTIVESGLDIPTVNTLVVDRSDLLGLAQLYQLRGRIGRRGQRAYAYLFHPREQSLTEEAYERLKTIGEFTDLGSGFKIAMRDLEIRGAGNMLGAEQSGHIAAVGFDLYCQLVTEAVGELKGETPPAPVEVTIDVPVDAYLPTEYLSRDDVRMEAYRRLAAVTTPADVDDIRDEWQDRYGPPPGPAAALLDVARLRAECVRTGMRSLSVQRGVARITGLELRESEKIRLRRLVPGAVAKADGEVAIPVSGSGAELCAALVDLLGELVPADEAAPVASAAP